MILLSAAVGAAASAFVFHGSMEPLRAAIIKNAAGYGELYKLAYTPASAFASAINVSRADIASIFLIILFPYTSAARILPASAAFIRAAIFVPAVPALISSPLGIISLAAGLISVFPVIFRADAVYSLRKNGGETAHFREAMNSVSTAVVSSGALLSARTLIFLFGSLIYGA